MAVPPPLPDPLADKSALRRTLRLARRRFAADRGGAAAAALRDRLRAVLPPAGIVAGYAAVAGEPDILPLLAELVAAGRTVALPRMADGAMRLVGWSGGPLPAGPRGIAEPPGGPALAADIVLTPLVGFDRRGARLGQGGGHYDRWFAAHPRALRIGVAWGVQEAAALPVEPWDVPLHAIVTEKEVIRP